MTISTVGYGDQYPVTNAGRVAGSLIIVLGVGIFGSFTGYLANLFLSPAKVRTEAAPTDVEAKVAQLKALIEQQQSAMEELDGLLAAEAPG